MEAITTSPAKRRALGALDANALPSPKALQLKKTTTTTTSPLKERKRLLDDPVSASSPLPQKKACFEIPHDRSRSQSPDASSIFDTSANDSSWATEPDASPVPRAMTRDQAREKAEILRLRLGLASYKFRTGQTSVPLADLQKRPLPGRSSAAAGEGDLPGAGGDGPASNQAPATISRPAMTTPARPRARTTSTVESARPLARAWGRIAHGPQQPRRRILGGQVDDDNDDDDDDGESSSDWVESLKRRRRSRNIHSDGRETRQDDEEYDDITELPRLSPSKYAISALREAEASRLADRELSDGAADGLLSLSRGNSDV